MPRATKSEVKIETALPTRDEIEQAAIWFATKTNRVPVLVGPTASGKTRMAMKIAQERDAKLITVLLQQDTPEEIAGFQAPIGDRLLALTPFWFDRAQESLNNHQNVLLFFDELGLSHELTRGAIYTFLRDREIRGRTLTCQHANPACSLCVLVVGAMNPAELAPAMLSRIAMLHVPADREHMLSLATTSLSKRIARLAVINNNKVSALSNEPPPPPTTYDLSAQAVVNAFDKDFWNLSEGVRNAIVTAVLPPSLIEEVFREDTLSTPSIDAQMRKPELILSVMRTLDAPSAASNAIELWKACTQYKLDEVIPVLLNVVEALSEDEEKQTLFFDINEESLVTWWSAQTPEAAEKLKDAFESTGLMIFHPEKPQGRLLDNYLMQAPPDQNEMTHLMSTEALAKWREKYGVK